MGKTVNIEASDKSGAFSAYLCLPEQGLPAPAVIVIQEVFGINRNMRHVCDALADAGFIALCPDLFWRLQPGVELNDLVEADYKKAIELYHAFDVEKGIE